jgi:hypothetical protein
MSASRPLLLSLTCGACLAVFSTPWAVGAEDVLAGTNRLTSERPIDEWMVEGLQRFCLRDLAASPARRSERWRPHLATRALLEERERGQ